MCFSLPTDNRVKRDFYHAISSFVTWIESLTRTLSISISSCMCPQCHSLALCEVGLQCKVRRTHTNSQNETRFVSIDKFSKPNYVCRICVSARFERFELHVAPLNNRQSVLSVCIGRKDLQCIEFEWDGVASSKQRENDWKKTANNYVYRSVIFLFFFVNGDSVAHSLKKKKRKMREKQQRNNERTSWKQISLWRRRRQWECDTARTCQQRNIKSSVTIIPFGSFVLCSFALVRNYSMGQWQYVCGQQSAYSIHLHLTTPCERVCVREWVHRHTKRYEKKTINL